MPWSISIGFISQYSASVVVGFPKDIIALVFQELKAGFSAVAD